MWNPFKRVKERQEAPPQITDPVISGVLDTIAARHDMDLREQVQLYQWAKEIGSSEFYDILGEEHATYFFNRLSEGEDLLDYPYELVGRAVDRVERAYQRYQKGLRVA